MEIRFDGLDPVVPTPPKKAPKGDPTQMPQDRKIFEFPNSGRREDKGNGDPTHSPEGQDQTPAMMSDGLPEKPTQSHETDQEE